MDIVVIVTGLGSSDIALMPQSGEAGAFIAGCARISGVTAPFPCLAHVSAVSALTGCSAAAHGLMHPFAATRGAPQSFRRAYDGESCLSVTTALMRLKKHKVDCAAFLCPSTAESKSASVCVPFLSRGGAGALIHAGRRAYRYRRLVMAESREEADSEAVYAVCRLSGAKKRPDIAFITLWNLYYSRREYGDNDDRTTAALMKTLAQLVLLRGAAHRLFVYGTGSLFSVINAYPLPQILRKTGLAACVYAQAADSGAYLFPYSGKERESERGFELLERKPELAGAKALMRLCGRCAGMSERPARVLKGNVGDVFIDSAGNAPMMASDLFSQSRGLYLFSGGGFVAGKKDISASCLDLLPTLFYTLGIEDEGLQGSILHGCF